MKKIIVLLVCVIASMITYGQNKMQNVMVNIEGIEVAPPQFTGIENVATLISTDKSQLIKNYLRKNAVYPESAARCMKEGTEVIQFTVTSAGKVTNLKVINSVCSEIDREVISVLESTDGMWKPGYNNGNLVDMEQEVSLVFAADDYRNLQKHFTKVATRYFVLGNKKMYLSKNPKKALRHYNHGIRYLPYDKSLLFVRGLCKYELGDEEGGREDWNRIAELGGIDFGDFNDLTFDFEKMKGYSEMAEILGK